jgi:hypothetical protein
VWQFPEQPAAEILEILQVRFADFAEQKTLQSRHPLTITRPICASNQCDLPPPRAPP